MKYLMEHELDELERAVTKMRGTLDPKFVEKLDRALWELRSLRGLSKSLMEHAGAMGLVEAERERDAERQARRDGVT